MKYILLSLFLLIGCNSHPRFKAGDCIISEGYESWEIEGKNSSYITIIEVGITHYHIYINQWKAKETRDIKYIDNNYNKIQCH
jgi:uncharacterized protein YcfL